MRTLGRNPTEDEIMNIMNEIDVDHNGKLDFSEFTIMMRDKLSGEDMEQEIKQAFRYVKVLNSQSIKRIDNTQDQKVRKMESVSRTFHGQSSQIYAYKTYKHIY